MLLIRCFAHIVNIAVQHVLAYITEAYKQQKAENPIAQVQEQIAHLQASNPQWTTFWNLIRQGNDNGDFNPKVPELELLQDMPVQWDSTFLMIESFLSLQYIVKCFYRHWSVLKQTQISKAFKSTGSQRMTGIGFVSI